MDLPNGADVTEMRCYYQDRSPSYDLEDFDFRLWSRALTEDSKNEIGSVESDPPSRNSPVVASFADSSISGPGDPIVNAQYAYWISVLMDLLDGSSQTPNVNFRGCRITYKLDWVSF